MKKIPLSQGKSALVDDEDYDWLSQHKWYAREDGLTWYAMRNKKKDNGQWSTCSMHSVVLGKKEGFMTDHINRNGLDNRRKNLRFCTSKQNQYNRVKVESASGYRGVKQDKRSVKGSWTAVYRTNKKRIHVGSFSTPEAAARAYDAAIKEVRGEFAVLNFPEEHK